MRKLTKDKYKIEDEEIKSTEGIDIEPWDLKVNLKESDKFRFDIWDFAGQKKYDATHQFFLTEDSLYLFLTTARQGTSFQDYEYWLNIIKIFSKDSPVLIIQNKIDERPDALPTKQFQDRFPNIKGFYQISCKSGFEHSIKYLEEGIKKGISSEDWLSQVGDELPKPWVEIRKELELLSADHITFDEYLTICSKHGLSKIRSEYLIRYFHNLGIVVYRNDDLLLKRLVIVNPDWAVDGAYAVLDTPSVMSRSGKFSIYDLEEIWKEDQYSEKRPELLQLMLSYGICFEIENTQTYIAPQLLSNDPVDYQSIERKNSLHFEYVYEFMPAGILSRFIVKVHPFIEGENYWKFGVILNFDDTRAEVIEDYLSRKITIKIEGENKKELLTIIRMQINSINSDFKNLNVKERILCNCNHCKKGKSNHHFEYKVLRRFERKGITSTNCNESCLSVNIPSLLNDSIPFNRKKVDKSHGNTYIFNEYDEKTDRKSVV